MRPTPRLLLYTYCTQQGRHTAAMRSVAAITVALSQVLQIDLRQLKKARAYVMPLVKVR